MNISSTVFNIKRIFLFIKSKPFTKQYASEEKHSDHQEREPVKICKDAFSLNCRSSAPPGAESINVLYKRHSKTQANIAVLGGKS